MSTQRLSAERSKEILVEAGLLASENAVQAELLETTLLKAGIGKEERNEILRKLKLITIQNGEAIAQGTCTAEDLKAILAQKLKNAEDVEGIMTALGLAGANATTTVSFELLTKAIWANIAAMAKWLVTNPLGWLILGTGAVLGLVKVIDVLTESAEEAGEAATAAKERYTEIESEIDGLNSKIKENNKLIAETNGEAKYDGYRKRLESENKELERQIELARIKAQEAKSESDKKATKALTSEDYEYNIEYTVDGAGAGYTTTSEKGDIAAATDWYLAQAETTGLVSNTLSDYIETITEQRENLDLSNLKSKELYDSLGLLIDRYIALYPNIKLASDEIANSSENADGLIVSLSELEKVSDSIKPLGTAFKELSDDGYITVKTLRELKDASDLSGDEWSKYEAKLLKAKIGSSEFNQIMSELTYKILDNAFAGKDLNEVTEEQIAATLRENGVVNASVVAHEWLTNAKIKNKLATFDFRGATQDEVDILCEELKALGLTETAVGNLSKAYAEAQAAMLKAASVGALNRLQISQDELKGIKTVAEAYKLLSGKSYDANGDGVGDFYGSEKNRSQFDKYRDQYNSDVESVLGIIKAQEEIEKIINGITTNTTTNYSGADKGKENEALDNYLKDAENRYKIHQDEKKYIQDLEYAYDNLTKTEKERLDITGKINEAYRDLADNRIKDIEHQIDLTKELHGEDTDVTTYYDQIQKIAHDEADRYREFARKQLGYYNDGITDEQKAEIDADIEKTDEIQELQKAWWDAQNSKIDFYTKQHESIIRDIEHARDMALSSNPFADTTSYYKQMQEEYHNEAERLRALDPEKYKEEIEKLQLAWWDAQKSIVDGSYSNSERWISERNAYNDWELYGDNEVDAWRRVLERLKAEYPNELEKIKEVEQKIFEARKKAMEKSISDIDDYIDARNHYNDWDAYGDSEIKAIQRQTEIIEDAYKQRLLSYEEYVKRIEENNQRLYSAAKNNVIETISNLIEDYEEKIQNKTDALGFKSSQYDSLKTLLQSYYDVTNAVAEAQHEINKELKASQSMYEYLNEETRDLLFNQEDYEVLNEKLIDIQSEANALQEQYNKDILNASKETIDEITSQYQMQYETMMKQYEIAKAELDVAKKRQKLDNVLAERNVRMFINGQWQWVANTQNVIDAQNELAEAEIQKEQAETSLEQVESINKLTLAQDDITTQINYLESDLEKVRKKWADMQKMLNGESSAVAKVLKEISTVSSPELKKVIEETGGSVSAFATSLSEAIYTLLNGGSSPKAPSSSQNYNATATLPNGTTVGVNINDKGKTTTPDLPEGTVVHTAGGDYKITGGSGGNYTSVLVSSSGGSSSSSSSSGKTVQVGSDGNAPAGTSVGDVVKTAGGDYLVVPYGTPGSSYNPASGLSSIKIDEKDADGTRYTSGGMTLMGEDGFEAFISNSGRLIPIGRPTIGNIGAGGIVFNREQMANLRNLWDLSNLGKIAPLVSSSNASKQSTTIDNSIHINGLTVSEQGNEDWINGLRRYVATHK